MKKISITILIFIFTATTVNYAAIYRNEKTDGNESPDTESLYEKSSDNFINSSHSVGDSEENSGGLFRSDPNSGPGGRPIIGDGIGEDSPLGNGLPTLVVLSILLGILKIYKNKSNK